MSASVGVSFKEGKKDMKPFNSAVIWEGKSPYDGAEIMVLAVCIKDPSKNRKTGWMIQIYILVKSVSPVEAVKLGLDASVCGNCSMRWNNGGGCYVLPIWITPTWKKGLEAPRITPTELAKLANKYNTPIRQGAYGDPAFVPMDVWEELENAVSNKKGSSYTHQWEWVSPEYAKFSMASVENLKQKADAQAKGYRTYRIVDDESEIVEDERLCLNSSRGIQCRECGECGGNRSKASHRQKNIVIVRH